MPSSVAPEEPETVPSPQRKGRVAHSRSLEGMRLEHTLDPPAVAPRLHAELHVLEIQEVALIKLSAIENSATDQQTRAVKPRGLEMRCSRIVRGRLSCSSMNLTRP